MKVLFLSVNASWTHSNLAIYYLRNTIAYLNHQTQIIELTLKQTYSEALEGINKASPDVICISVYIWNLNYYSQIMFLVRKLFPQIIIVAGGPEISFNQESADLINPDVLIMGDGLKAFYELAENDFKFRKHRIVGEYQSLQDIPFPYKGSDHELLKGKMIYYEASRGCVCRCIYCLSSREEKLDWLPVDRVCTDIDKLIAMKPKVIKFVDRSFNHKMDWARAIWRYVIGLKTDIPFHFEIHPDWLEIEDIILLKQAPKGRIQFEIGIQSIHPETLEAICRFSDWQKVKTMLVELKNNTQVNLHLDLIVGLPKDGIHQIKESVNAVLRTYPYELQLGFLKVLQGTPMVEYASEHGYIWSDKPPYNVFQTPHLTLEKIIYLEKIAQIINQYWNKGDFSSVWQKAVEWREPYQCLEELFLLNQEKSKSLHSIERVSRFDHMARWLDTYWTAEQCEYLQDALRWDWCRKSSEAWYPDSLKGNNALQFRKQQYADIYKWLKREYWEHEDWNLKRFTVFSALSNDFCKDNLDGYSKAVFVSCSGAENIPIIYKERTMLN